MTITPRKIYAPHGQFIATVSEHQLLTAVTTTYEGRTEDGERWAMLYDSSDRLLFNIFEYDDKVLVQAVQYPSISCKGE